MSVGRRREADEARTRRVQRTHGPNDYNQDIKIRVKSENEIEINPAGAAKAMRGPRGPRGRLALCSPYLVRVKLLLWHVLRRGEGQRRATSAVRLAPAPPAPCL